MYEVKLNVPIPKFIVGPHIGAFAAALKSLPVGGMIEAEKSRQPYTSQYGKKWGRKFTTRKLKEKPGYIGIWRIE